MFEGKTLRFNEAEVVISFSENPAEKPKVAITDKKTGTVILINYPDPKSIHSVHRQQALRHKKQARLTEKK